MFCSQCGQQLSDSAKRCGSCGQRVAAKSIHILGTVLTVVAVIAVISYFGYHRYRFTELKSRLEVAIGTDAGYTETILKIESDAANITYGEVFALCDKSIEDRQKLIVELRGLHPEMTYALKDKLIQFLNTENEIIRAKRSFYRQQMQLSTALDILLAHAKDPPSSIYGWQYYNRRTAQLKHDVRDKSKEMFDSADTFLAAYHKIVDQEKALAAEMKLEGLRFDSTFKKYEEKHVIKVNEAKKNADNVRKQFST